MRTLLAALALTIVGVAPAAALGPATFAGGPNPIARPCGDASEDFTTNSLDALLMLQVNAGLLKEPAVSYSFIEDWLFFNANLDQDINSLDALLTLQYDAGLLKALPNCYDVK